MQHAAIPAVDAQSESARQTHKLTYKSFANAEWGNFWLTQDIRTTRFMA